MGLFSNNFLLFLLLLVLATLFSSSTVQSFNCTTTTPKPCHALIDYKPVNTTTLSSIKTLFQIKNLRTILGANNFLNSTSQNETISPPQTIKIPFYCTCSNGTGISDKKPIYTVQPGDGLDYIARQVFSEVVTYQKIAQVNNISDPNNIDVGQKLWIPLPCSCDEVGGEKVVHYGLIVKTGSTLEQIAGDYGTQADILTSLNAVDDTSLKAGQVLDVPLRACNSSVNTSSLDYPLLVSNGTYVFTANSCVRCNCDSANNWTLQCKPSGLTPANSSWSTCPSMRCGGADNLSLGSATTAECSTTTCAYSGFSNQSILTTLATASTCPVSNPDSGSYASRFVLEWKVLFISLHLIMLCVSSL